MKASIGNSLLLTIVIIISSLVMLVFVNIISYAKAYRVKNGIIEILERNMEYNSKSEEEIKQYLKQVGYKTGTCPKDEYNNKTGYKVCIERKELSDGGYSFKITTYMDYEFPVINSSIFGSVSSETKILRSNYIDYG